MRPFLRYTTAVLKERRERALYRTYLTEVARMTLENTSRLSGGAYVRDSYHSLLHPRPADACSGTEIAQDIITRAGLEVVGD